MRRLRTIILILFLSASAAVAQEDPDDDSFFEDPFATDDETSGTEGSTGSSPDDPFATDDFDSLFQDEDMIDVTDEEAMAVDPQNDLLEQELVRVGGRIRGSLAADWFWDNVATPEFDPWPPDEDSLSPSVGADLFFDARPNAEFRAYTKLQIDTVSDAESAISFATVGTAGLPEGWTAEPNENGVIEIRDENGTLITTTGGGGQEQESEEEEPALGTTPGLEISVFELFADYTWHDTLFFRFGKHTLHWGTGYFFSPADVLNLTAVDPEDPTADREGPLSLRASYPFGVARSAYLYLIANADADLFDVAIAPKIEFAVGNGELGFGAYYQRTLSPRLVTLYSASVGDVDLFGEAVLMWGSDRVFVRPSRDQSAAIADPDDGLDLVLDTYEVDRGLFLQSTVGARYLHEWDGGTSIAVAGQYLFNGDGYSGEVAGLLPAAVRLALNSDENGLLIEDEEEQQEGYEDPPDLRFSDLSTWGRHYLAGTISLANLFVDDLSVAVFGIWNLTDLSAIVTPSISYRFLEAFNASLSARFTIGPPDGEFTDPAALYAGEDAQPTLGLTLTISMPGGSF
jgi:hypothetical protein